MDWHMSARLSSLSGAFLWNLAGTGGYGTQKMIGPILDLSPNYFCLLIHFLEIASLVFAYFGYDDRQAWSSNRLLLLFQHPNNKATLDLLWKYYERNGNFMAADKILMKLAEREGYELNKKPYIISFRNIFRFIMSRVRKLTVEVNAFRLGNRRTFLWGSQQPSFARFLLIRFDLLILTIFRPVWTFHFDLSLLDHRWRFTTVWNIYPEQ